MVLVVVYHRNGTETEHEIRGEKAAREFMREQLQLRDVAECEWYAA